MTSPMQSGLGTEPRWPAPAKLNLFLHVTGRRSDGYHELQTVFQFLDYGDELAFSPRDDARIERHGDVAGVAPENDLCTRAAHALQASAGMERGVDIRLVKRLPIGAGLGGGSSDAATTLVALNRLWGLDWPVERLAALALTLGADVPVFVRGRAAWAEGVGERLAPVELPEPWFLVVVPDCVVSTAAVFADTQLTRNTPRITMTDFIEGRTGNDCEPVVTRRHPPVAAALRWLQGHCERGTARMSGTGSAVFAAYETRARAFAVRAEVPRQWRAFVARGLNRSPLQAHVADHFQDNSRIGV